MQDKIQEIMGLVLNVACAGIDYGRATQTADGGALKRLHDAEKEVETKLRELVREPLSDEQMETLIEKHAPPIHPDFSEDDDFDELVRAVESAHNITNTSK